MLIELLAAIAIAPGKGGPPWPEPEPPTSPTHSVVYDTNIPRGQLRCTAILRDEARGSTCRVETKQPDWLTGIDGNLHDPNTLQSLADAVADDARRNGLPR